YKRMRPGSGGSGRFRGGPGQDILMESESEAPIAMVFMAERTSCPAPGFAGGRDGGRGDGRIHRPLVHHRRQYILKRGDQVLVSTPGGGGYGSPFERDGKLAQRDRALGYVPHRARRRALPKA